MNDSHVPDNASLSPETESQKPAGEYKLRDYLESGLDAMHKADTDARNDPLLRVQMCELIEFIGIAVHDHAFALAKKRGRTDAFEEDVEADLIVWQLAEFFAQGHLERNPNEPPVLRGWQVDIPHAEEHFQVSRLADETFVAVDDKGEVQS